MKSQHGGIKEGLDVFMENTVWIAAWSEPWSVSKVVHSIRSSARRALLNTRSMVDAAFLSLVAPEYVIVPWERRSWKSKSAIRLIKGCPSPCQLCEAIQLPPHKVSHRLKSPVRISSRCGLASCSWRNTLYKRFILSSSCVLSARRLFVLHGTYTDAKKNLGHPLEE